MTDLATHDVKADGPTPRTPKILRRKRSRGRTRRGTPIRGLIPLVILLALWQILGSASSISFPPPDAWIDGLRDIDESGTLWPAVFRTLSTFLVSILIAAVVGVLAGMAIGSSKRLDRATAPALDFFRALPPPVLVPIGALLFGISFMMCVIVVVVSIIWPIVLSTASARRQVPSVRLDASRVLGLSFLERLTKITLPSVIPGAFVGIKLAVSYALVASLLVDILGSGTGIGRLIVERQSIFDSQAVWGLLLIVGVFGYLLNSLISLLEQVLMRNWGPSGLPQN